MACRLVGDKPLSEPMLECWNIVNWTLRNKFQWNLNISLFHDGVAGLKIRKNIYRFDIKLFVSFRVISIKYLILILINKATFTKYCLTQWISKLLGELWNSLTLKKTVPDKFYGSVEHSKCDSLQDWAGPIFIGPGHGKLSWFLTLELGLLYVVQGNWVLHTTDDEHNKSKSRHWTHKRCPISGEKDSWLGW